MIALSSEALADFVGEIEAPDPTRLRQARLRLDRLTKPRGSLGRMEDIAAQYISIRNGDQRFALNKAAYVFAADHGIAAEGVSAYGQEVTRQMVLNFLDGGAAINVLARLHHAALAIVDVGVDADFGNLPGLLHRKIRRGSRNMLQEPAMSEEEMMRALEVGLDLASSAQQKKQTLIAIGEMGIGNTTAASAITAVLTRQPPAAVTGTGTGLTAPAHAHKIRVVEAIVERHFGVNPQPRPRSLDILRRVGGLELAAMVGLVLGAARHRIAIIADGFISTAAAALAYALEPRVKYYLFAAHHSPEPGHRFLLEYLQLDPILSLDLRLGEGTGALLAMPIIESAVRLYTDMATFGSAGVSEAQA
jgi:nicotinate-nucleotide--dimethylbenzimidazole phosphoribosyltransferase